MSDSHPTASLPFETVAIVGVGLIGGSIAAALKQRGYTGQIIGVGRNSARLEAAVAKGLIDSGTTGLADAASHSELLVFCTPVELIAEGVKRSTKHCRRGTLITDAGSVKSSICRAISGDLPEGVTFIGSHPLAGSEQQGFEHADGELFVDSVCVITPGEATPDDQKSRLAGFWEYLGMKVVELSPEAHDCALAETSHVPHVAAAALAALLADSNRPFAATGFLDTTRIASGDPELWTEILLANADEIDAGIAALAGQLDDFRRAIEHRDAAALKKLLQLAKTNRESVTGPQ